MPPRASASGSASRGRGKATASKSSAPGAKRSSTSTTSRGRGSANAARGRKRRQEEEEDEEERPDVVDLGGDDGDELDRTMEEAEEDDQGEGEDDDDDEEEDEDGDREKISPELVTRVLHAFFEREGTRITRDANAAVARYVDVFVREAIARAAVERERGFLEVSTFSFPSPFPACLLHVGIGGVVWLVADAGCFRLRTWKRLPRSC